MQSLNLLNLASQTKNSGPLMVVHEQQSAKAGGFQVSENKGLNGEFSDFAPVLDELLMQARQAGVDTSDPAAMQQFFSQELGQAFESTIQSQGLDPEALLAMSGQELADSLNQAGITLPPGRQSELVTLWDSPQSSEDKLAGLATTIIPESPSVSPQQALETALQAIKSSVGETTENDTETAVQVDRDDAQSPDVLPLNTWILSSSVSTSGSVQGGGNVEHAGLTTQIGPAWLANGELRDRARSTAVASSAPGASSSPVNADAVSGSKPVTETGLWQYQQGQPANGSQPAGMALSSEADTLFKSQLDAAFSDLKGEGADELRNDRQSIALRASELHARPTESASRVYTTAVQVPVGDPQWNDQVSQKIVWLTGRQIQAAEIHVNPADLGPVEVKISVTNEQATVSFNAQNASVRELLEANVHRLREMMESNGVELGDVNVGNGEPDAQYASEQGGTGSGQAGSGDSGDGHADAEDTELVAQATSDRLVDFYA